MTRDLRPDSILLEYNTGHIDLHNPRRQITRCRTSQTEFSNGGRFIDPKLITGHEHVRWEDIRKGDLVIIFQLEIDEITGVRREALVRVTNTWDLTELVVVTDQYRSFTPSDNIIAQTVIPNDAPRHVPMWSRSIIRDNAGQEFLVIDQDDPARVEATSGQNNPFARNGREKFSVKRLRDIKTHLQTNYNEPPERAGDLVFDFEYNTLVLVESLTPHYTPPPPPPEDVIEETSTAMGEALAAMRASMANMEAMMAAQP